MTDQPQIRRFAAADGPGCWATFVAAVRIGARDHYSAQELAEWLPDDSYPEDYAAWLQETVTFVADQDGTVQGFIMMDDSGYLDLLFVLPAQRRSGLAGRLYQALLAEAMGRGLRRLTVKASRLAQPFLARRGWRVSVGPDGQVLGDEMSTMMEIEL